MRGPNRVPTTNPVARGWAAASTVQTEHNLGTALVVVVVLLLLLLLLVRGGVVVVELLLRGGGRRPHPRASKS